MRNILNMNRLFRYLSVFCLLVLTVGIGSYLASADSGKKSSNQKMPKVRSEMLISTNQLAAQMKKSNPVILYIGRDRKNFDKEHISGSRFVAWNEITTTRDGIPNNLPPVEELQKLFTRLGTGNSGKIVIYGEVSGLFAARAFFTLDYLGHGDRMALLDGGLEKWKSEKRPTTQTEVKYESKEFTPRINPQTLLTIDPMRDMSWLAVNQTNPTVSLIDARPADQFSGEVPGDGVKRSGHIPGAKNVFWMQNIVSEENPVMRPVNDLRKMYADAGVKPENKIISYCRTGGQASYTYFTLKYLGYDVAMYDGSFFEWSNLPDTKVEK